MLFITIGHQVYEEYIASCDTQSRLTFVLTDTSHETCHPDPTWDESLKSPGALDQLKEKSDVQAKYIASSDTQSAVTSVRTDTAHKTLDPDSPWDKSLKTVANPQRSGEYKSNLPPEYITKSDIQPIVTCVLTDASHEAHRADPAWVDGTLKSAGTLDPLREKFYVQAVHITSSDTPSSLTSVLTNTSYDTHHADHPCDESLKLGANLGQSAEKKCDIQTKYIARCDTQSAVTSVPTDTANEIRDPDDSIASSDTPSSLTSVLTDASYDTRHADHPCDQSMKLEANLGQSGEKKCDIQTKYIARCDTQSAVTSEPTDAAHETCDPDDYIASSDTPSSLTSVLTDTSYDTRHADHPCDESLKLGTNLGQSGEKKCDIQTKYIARYDTQSAVTSVPTHIAYETHTPDAPWDESLKATGALDQSTEKSGVQAKYIYSSDTPSSLTSVLTDTSYETRHADHPCDESLKLGANLGQSGEKKCDIKTKYIARCDTQSAVTSVPTDIAYETHNPDAPWDESLKATGALNQSTEKSDVQANYIASSDMQSTVTSVSTDTANETRDPAEYIASSATPSSLTSVLTDTSYDTHADHPCDESLKLGTNLGQSGEKKCDIQTKYIARYDTQSAVTSVPTDIAYETHNPDAPWDESLKATGALDQLTEKSDVPANYIASSDTQSAVTSVPTDTAHETRDPDDYIASSDTLSSLTSVLTDTSYDTCHADHPCDDSLKSGANLGQSGEKKCDIEMKYIARCDTQFAVTSVPTDIAYETHNPDLQWDESLKSTGALEQSKEKSDVQPKYIARSDTQSAVTSVPTDTAHETLDPDPPWDERLKSVAKPGRSGKHKSNLPLEYIAATDNQSIVTCVLTDASHESLHVDRPWVDGSLKSAGTLDPSGEKFDIQANYITSSDTQSGLTSVLTDTAHESRHPDPSLGESLKLVAKPVWSGEMSNLQRKNITSSIQSLLRSALTDTSHMSRHSGPSSDESLMFAGTLDRLGKQSDIQAKYIAMIDNPSDHPDPDRTLKSAGTLNRSGEESDVHAERVIKTDTQSLQLLTETSQKIDFSDILDWTDHGHHPDINRGTEAGAVLHNMQRQKLGQPSDSDDHMFSESDDDSLHDPDYVMDSSEESSDDNESAESEVFPVTFITKKQTPVSCFAEGTGTPTSIICSENSPPPNASAQVISAVRPEKSSDDSESAESDVFPVTFITKKQTPVSCPAEGTGSPSSIICRENSPPPNESAHVTSAVGLREAKKKKIPRPCVFCGKFQTNLNRHLSTQHSNQPAVEHALKLPFEERCIAISNLRKDGIMKYNKTQMKVEGHAYERERSRTNDDHLVLCNGCNGFYSKKYFARHSKQCKNDVASQPQALPVKHLMLLADDQVSDEFKADVLAKFSNNPVGDICRSDASIVMYGHKMYEKIHAKQDKVYEVKRSVMSDMRRLATLFLKFSSVCQDNVPALTSSDMLTRNKFESLLVAIKELTYEDGQLKAGLKTAYYYLLKKFAKVVKASFLVRDDDEKAAEIDKFLEVLALNQHIVFGDATYVLNQNRQSRLRRPESLPSEEDVTKLKAYTVNRIQELTADDYKMWDTPSFTELRDLAVSRLTLFNARRGGEPARLTLTEWSEADNSTWLNSQHTKSHSSEDLEKRLFKEMKVTFQSGKGNNHLVPILIPRDTFAAMKLLSDKALREAADVSSSNTFMFPSTKHSAMHISGWHAVSRVCAGAGVEHPERLTATRMRHRISTLYAGLDVSENDRQLFYKHMGHSSNINANIYQTPPAEAEILRVGAQLLKMDGRLPSGDSGQAVATQHEGNSCETEVDTETVVETGSEVCENINQPDSDGDSEPNQGKARKCQSTSESDSEILRPLKKQKRTGSYQLRSSGRTSFRANDGALGAVSTSSSTTDNEKLESHLEAEMESGGTAVDTTQNPVSRRSAKRE